MTTNPHACSSRAAAIERRDARGGWGGDLRCGSRSALPFLRSLTEASGVGDTRGWRGPRLTGDTGRADSALIFGGEDPISLASLIFQIFR